MVEEEKPTNEPEKPTERAVMEIKRKREKKKRKGKKCLKKEMLSKMLGVEARLEQCVRLPCLKPEFPFPSLQSFQDEV